MKEMDFCDIKPFVRYSRKMDFGRNMHRGTRVASDARLCYCVEGLGQIEVAGVPYPICPGTLLIWRGGMPYRFLPNEQTPMTLYAFNFDFTWEHIHRTIPIPPDTVELFRREQMTDDLLFSDAVQFNKPLLVENMQRLLGEIQDIDRIFNQARSHYQLRCSGLAANLLGFVATHTDATGSYKQYRALVSKVIDYLQQNFAQKLTTQDLGAHFGYHPNYISALVYQETGQSLYTYLLNLRLNCAIQLLQETTLSVGQIAVQSGFGSPAHFSKMFKKKTGRAPSDFRR